MSEVTLEKIDQLRDRTGIGYRRAKELLEAHGGDVVEALIALEEQSEPVGQWHERITVTGHELVAKVKELIHEGNVRRIIIKKDDRVLLEIPVTVGALGAILLPTLAAIGVVAALATSCTLVVVRRGNGQQEDAPDEDPGLS